MSYEAHVSNNNKAREIIYAPKCENNNNIIITLLSRYADVSRIYADLS